jgi:hypothetical protein
MLQLHPLVEDTLPTRLLDTYLGKTTMPPSGRPEFDDDEVL